MPVVIYHIYINNMFHQLKFYLLFLRDSALEKRQIKLGPKKCVYFQNIYYNINTFATLLFFLKVTRQSKKLELFLQNINPSIPTFVLNVKPLNILFGQKWNLSVLWTLGLQFDLSYVNCSSGINEQEILCPYCDIKPLFYGEIKHQWVIFVYRIYVEWRH